MNDEENLLKSDSKDGNYANATESDEGSGDPEVKEVNAKLGSKDDDKGVSEEKTEKSDKNMGDLPDKYGYSGPKRDGMRHGIGKEFNAKGHLKYEGSWVNGKRHGNGVVYNRNGQISYKGELVNGLKHGKGKEYGDDGRIIYEGGFVNGSRQGKNCKVYDENGQLKYAGNFVHGHRYGTGQSYCVNRKGQNLTYIGIWSACTALIPDIILYHGEHQDGHPCGYGVEYEHVEGRRLEEDDGKKHDLHFKGEFLMGRVNLAQGDIIYEGEFKNGLRHGKGFYYPQGKTKYNQGGGEKKDLILEGTWVNGDMPSRPSSKQAPGVKIDDSKGS